MEALDKCRWLPPEFMIKSKAPAYIGIWRRAEERTSTTRHLQSLVLQIDERFHVFTLRQHGPGHWVNVSRTLIDGGLY